MQSCAALSQILSEPFIYFKIHLSGISLDFGAVTLRSDGQASSGKCFHL